MTPTTLRAPAVLGVLGSGLAFVCFITASMSPGHDEVSSAIQGLVFIGGGANLVVAFFSLGFLLAARPWSSATRVFWGLWLVVAAPVLGFGFLVSFAVLAKWLGR